jgi:hypothetical protein
MYFEDTTDNSAIGQHVEVILVPLAGGTAVRGPFQDELSHFEKDAPAAGACRGFKRHSYGRS